MAEYIKPEALVEEALINANMDIMVMDGFGSTTPGPISRHSKFYHNTCQIDGKLHTSLTRLTLIPTFKDANEPDADYIILQGNFCLNDGTPFNGRCEIWYYQRADSPITEYFEFNVTGGMIGTPSEHSVQIPLNVLERQIEWKFYCVSDYHYRYTPSMIPCIDEPIGVRFPETLGLDGSYVGGEEFEANYVMVNCEMYPGSYLSVEVETDDGGYGNPYPILTINALTNPFQGQAGDGFWDPAVGNEKLSNYIPVFQQEAYTVPVGSPFGDNKVRLEGTALPTIILYEDWVAGVHTVVHLPVYDSAVNLILTYELDRNTYEFAYVDSYIV